MRCSRSASAPPEVPEHRNDSTPDNHGRAEQPACGGMPELPAQADRLGVRPFFLCGRRYNMTSKHRKEKQRVRLELERLEDRTVPTVITVFNVSQLASAVQTSGNFDVIQMTAGGYLTQGTPI